MMNETKLYRFGGLTFGFSGLQPQRRQYLDLFEVKDTWADIAVSVSALPELKPPEERETLFSSYSFCVYAARRKRYALYREFSRPHAMLCYKPSLGEPMELFVCPEVVTFDESVLLSSLMLEDIFLRASKALLHASYIEVDGGAVLFSAPCGTGKSTQAALWHKYRGAEIINGDKAVLWERDGGWWASGLPLAGTSDICKNRNLPVRAIVALSQAPENAVTRLSGGNGVKAILSQLYVQAWSRESVEAAAAVAVRLAAKLPVYHLACLPEASAVELLEKTLREES